MIPLSYHVVGLAIAAWIAHPALATLSTDVRPGDNRETVQRPGANPESPSTGDTTLEIRHIGRFHMGIGSCIAGPLEFYGESGHPILHIEAGAKYPPHCTAPDDQ